eukprot:CAMPEP_0196764314 /NCGR_PEP_ID=MMETSP1095-20130614/5873_1 /TAXON_ID=96789 ORGANISM="Chromulina nebulosa, Strain UTEXLB2642" /NCGR_SAMPLE_ID=MMETSP1095 /ASSEMBLY_ACC=CAM_ASM_000446 /LENGTH=641 /DNA_ID=CAMNT_0042119585 /DNA_START=104 /DNA_END=2026 /DNA_ORIENTATION=+
MNTKGSIHVNIEEKNDIKKQSLLIRPSTLYNSTFETKDIEEIESDKPYENGINFNESPSNIKNIYENHTISKALDFNDVDSIINLPMVHDSPYKSIHNSVDYNQNQHEDGNGNSNNIDGNKEEIIEEEIIEEIIDDNNNDEDDEYEEEENIREEDINDNNDEDDEEDDIDDEYDDHKDNIDEIIEDEDEYDIVNPGDEDSQCIEVFEDELEIVNNKNPASWFNIDNYSLHIVLAYVMLSLLFILMIYLINHDGSIILSENKNIISLFQSTSYNSINSSLDSEFIETAIINNEFIPYNNEVIDEAVSNDNSTDYVIENDYVTNDTESEIYIYNIDINFDANEVINETTIKESNIDISAVGIVNQYLNEVVINIIDEIAPTLILSEDNNEQVDENSEIEPITTEILLQVNSNQIISDTDAIDITKDLEMGNNEVSSDDQINIDTHEVDTVVSTNVEVYEEVLDNVIPTAIESDIIIESVEMVEIEIISAVDSITVDNIIVVETIETLETNDITDSASPIEDGFDDTTSDITIETISKITNDITISPDININSISNNVDPVVTKDNININTDNNVSDPTLVFICLVITSIGSIIGLLYIYTFQKNDFNDLTNEIIFENELAYLSNQSIDNNLVTTNPPNISLSW